MHPYMPASGCCKLLHRRTGCAAKCFHASAMAQLAAGRAHLTALLLSPVSRSASGWVLQGAAWFELVPDQQAAGAMVTCVTPWRSRVAAAGCGMEGGRAVIGKKMMVMGCWGASTMHLDQHAVSWCQYGSEQGSEACCVSNDDHAFELSDRKGCCAVKHVVSGHVRHL
jgi:hypothetical protein